MQCYLLVFGDADAPTDRLERAFPKNYKFSAKAWAIASEKPTTCSDVVDELTQGEDPPWTCVVARLESYNGYAENSLWEKIGLWESL